MNAASHGDPVTLDVPPRRWRPHPIAAALLAGTVLAATLCGTVILCLTRVVPGVLETPLATDRPGWVPYPLELTPERGPRGVRTARARLFLGNYETLTAHAQVHLLVASHDTQPLLVDAALTVTGSECRYVAPAGATFPNNGVLTLIGAAGCRPLRGVPTGDLELVIRYRNPARPALWTLMPNTTLRDADLIYVLPDRVTADQVLPALRGVYVDLFDTRTRRIALLSYLWNLGGTAWIWSVLAGACVMFAAGAGLVMANAGAARGSVRWEPAAFGLAAASLSVLYALLTIPFGAPDEPAHFITYGTRYQTTLVGEAEAWGRRNHFSRIQFDPSQRFHPADRATPLETPWLSVGPQDPARSGTIGALQRVVAAIVSPRNTAGSFLALRLANAVVFGLAFAASAWLARRARVRAGPLLLPFLLVPTMPFFGMHVSDHATLIACYVVLVTSVMCLLADRGYGGFIGLPLGLVLGLTICTSRSGLPMFLIGAAALIARACLGSEHAAGDSPRARKILWSGVAAGGALALLFSGRAYWRRIAEDTVKLVPGAGELAGALIAVHWLVPFALAAAGFALESVCARVRTRAGGSLARPLGWAVQALAVLAALAIPISFGGSLMMRYPHLANVPLFSRRPDVLPYLADVFATLGTSLRLRDHDLLMSTSFWGGLGWIDALPDPALTSALVLLTGCALGWTLLGVARSRDLRGGLWILLVTAGVAGTVAAYAAITLKLVPDVHGRYLVGAYLTMIAISWSFAWRSRSDRGYDTIALLVGVTAVHAYSLVVVLTRFT